VDEGNPPEKEGKKVQVRTKAKAEAAPASSLIRIEVIRVTKFIPTDFRVGAKAGTAVVCPQKSSSVSAIEDQPLASSWMKN